MNASAVYRDVQLSSVAMTSKNGKAMKTSCQQSYDHAKQYDNDAQVMYMKMMEVAWQYISEWL